jgi:uncharacterized membrane protein
VDAEPGSRAEDDADRLAVDTPEEGTAALDRLIFFSDAVFAIAMTLLVLDIPRPAPHEAVAGFLTTLNKKFIGYFISFWVIGIYWSGHHRLFRAVRRYDQGVIFLNLLVLFFVAFIPYPSALLSERPGDVAATVFYSICVSAVGITFTGLAGYTVLFRRFAGPQVSRVARFYVYRGLIVPVVFGASIVVVQVTRSTEAAQVMWLLTFVPLIFGSRVARRLQPGSS